MRARGRIIHLSLQLSKQQMQILACKFTERQGWRGVRTVSAKG